MLVLRRNSEMPAKSRRNSVRPVSTSKKTPAKRRRNSVRPVSTSKKVPATRRRNSVNSASKKMPIREEDPSFPIQSIQEIMQHKLMPRTVVTPESAIFVTAILEYLAVEMLEHTVNSARTRMWQDGRSFEDLMLEAGDFRKVIEGDEELYALIQNARK